MKCISVIYHYDIKPILSEAAKKLIWREDMRAYETLLQDSDDREISQKLNTIDN